MPIRFGLGNSPSGTAKGSDFHTVTAARVTLKRGGTLPTPPHPPPGYRRFNHAGGRDGGVFALDFLSLLHLQIQIH